MVVDLFYRTPRIIGADEKILLDARRDGAATQQTAVGGVVLNHLGWARILGLNAGIFGKMGDDAHGKFLRDGMDALGIRHHLTLDGSASSFANIFIDRAGDRSIYMMRAATAELRPGEIRRRHGAFIRRASIVSTEVSQLPLPTVIAVLEFARAHSITTVLDVDVPPSDACATLGTRTELERALRLATILKPAKSAARELAGSSRDILKMGEVIRRQYGNQAVVITDGNKGCAIVANEASFLVPAFRVKQIDSTGAGDAHTGVFVAAMAAGLDPISAAHRANAAAAVSVTRRGPATAPTIEELERFLAASQQCRA